MAIIGYIGKFACSPKAERLWKGVHIQMIEKVKWDKKWNKRVSVFLAISLCVMIGCIAGEIILSRQQMDVMMGEQETKSDATVYNRHYALIMEQPEEQAGTEIFEGSRKEGKKTGTYVELMGEGLDVEYSRVELAQIAIAAQVDGIILEAEDTEEYQNVIAQAQQENIPVVTVVKDCADSQRKSYVGVGGYNLGREYGRQIIKFATKENRKVLILLDAATDDSTQNIICNGIKDTLVNEGNHLRLELEIKAVDSRSAFSAEESIRNMFVDMEELPDFIICLNEKNTDSVYQAVVDYNIVGQIYILGYYTSDAILQAVDKNIISGTIAVDFKEMGSKCVDALNEYLDTGYVNGYFLMEGNSVTKSNVKEYLKNASEVQE